MSDVKRKEGENTPDDREILEKNNRDMHGIEIDEKPVPANEKYDVD